MNSNDLLTVTTAIGSLLTEYGAEIYRVEETIYRIAAAYGYTENGKSVEVFAIPTSLIITVDGGDGFPMTRTKRILSRRTNLDRVDKINNLSRYICAEKPDKKVILKHIDEIKNRKVYSFITNLVSNAVVGFTFSLFFGGGLVEASIAGIIAILIMLVETAVAKTRQSTFFQCVICSFMTASLAVLCTRVGITDNFDKIIIGASMTMVPGITLTNCMRDFISGDFLAGLYTLTEALIVAVGMAVGAATAISIFTNLM